MKPQMVTWPVEIRRHWIVSDIDWLDAKPLWNGLNCIGMVERERHINDKVTSGQVIIF